MIGFDRDTGEEKVAKKFFLSIVIFMFLSGIYTGMYCYRFGLLADAKTHLQSFKINPSAYLKYTFSDAWSDLPRVDLDVKFQNYMTLSNQRSRFVYSFGHFFKGDQWMEKTSYYAKSELKYKGEKYKTKVKLFGLNNDHFRHPYKWSFRVKTKDFVPEFKNEKFNLLQPHTRLYLSDVICNAVFKEQDILNLEYIPINLRINDRKEDIYFVEDFFSKNLIERNNYRDSYIFSFVKIKHPSLDKLLPQQHEDLQAIQNDLIQSPDKIMDLRKFDVFTALTFMTQNQHPVLEENFHMFYNSVTNKIEPLIREVWFEKTLAIDSEDELRRQLKTFIAELIKSNHFLTAYFDGILNDSDRFDELVAKVNEVSNNIDGIMKSDQWKTLKDQVYSRYPQAIYNCRNIELNTETILQLNLKPLAVKIEKNKVKVIDQDVQLDADLELTNTDLKIMSNVTIDLNGYNIIIESGKIEAISDTGSSIFITNTSDDNASIVVKKAKDTSHLKGVIIKDISNFSSSYWRLPSALTFYESNVIIEESSFESNKKGDDFINLFRCDYFMLKDVDFKNILADAIDTDFSSGSITNCTFNGIGNDAIDGSGSNVTIADCSFKNVMDKVISAGEKSSFQISDSGIEDSEIAFVSKDGSKLFENNNTISRNKLDYCVFNKKEEFAPGILYTDKNIKNYSYLIEKKSQVFKDKNLLKDIIMIDSVTEKLYGAEYGRKSIK